METKIENINSEDIKNIKIIIEVEMKDNSVYKICTNDVLSNFEITTNGKHKIYDFWVK